MARIAPQKTGFRADIRLMQDLRKEFGLDGCPVLLNAEDVARVFGGLAELKREVLVCATVDCKCRLIHWALLSIGSSDRVVMRLGDAFHGAIRHSARGVILVHNHPSGSLSISAEDLELTQSVAEAGELLGYALLDHIILSRHGCRSVLAARRQCRQKAPAGVPSLKLEAAERKRSSKSVRAGMRG